MRIFKTALFLAAVTFGTTFVYHATQQADIQYFRGHDLFVRGKYGEAIPFFEKAVSRKSKPAEAMTKLAYAYLWTGRTKEALGVFENLLVLDPRSARTQKAMAAAYSWDKQYGKAAELYLQVLETGGKDTDATKKLAEVYLWDQQYEKAEKILAAFLQEYPRDVRAKFLYAKSLQYSGKTMEAAAVYRELLNEKESTPVKSL